MQFAIEIINVQSTTKPTAKGSYTMLDVAFKRLDTGKIEGKKIMSFTNKDVFNILSTATNGNQFTITSEKNEKTTYWDWTAVTPLSGGTEAPSGPAKSFTSPKSTYETSDERAARQVLIVRQSCLAQAVATMGVNPGKDRLNVDEILTLADRYNRWVFQKETQLGEDFADMQDDVPM